MRTLQQKNKSDGVIKVRPIRKDENWVLAIDFNNLIYGYLCLWSCGLFLRVDRMIIDLSEIKYNKSTRKSLRLTTLLREELREEECQNLDRWKE